MSKTVKELGAAIYEKEGKIARIILNRPEKLNALNAQLRWDIVECINMIEEDDNVLVGIIKGNGRAFSAGADLGAVYNRYGGGKKPDGTRMKPSQRARLWVDTANFEFLRRAYQCWKPLICQVHGYCLGAALMLSDCCDITVASDDCLFGHPEQRQAFGGMLHLQEAYLLGPKKARELILLGNKIDGKEAERIGLINHSVPTDQLEPTVEGMANSIAKLPRDAVAMGKMATLMVYENMGYTSCHTQFLTMHTLATNLRFEPDETNFMRTREKLGTKAAIRERDTRFEQQKNQEAK